MIYLISVPKPGEIRHRMAGLRDEAVIEMVAILWASQGDKVYKVNWFIHWLYHSAAYKLAIRLAIKYGREWSDD